MRARLASIVILTTSAVASLHAQGPQARPSRAPCDIFCHARLAHRAEAADNYAEQERHVRAVAALAPSHPGVVYEVARALARRGRADSAVATLLRLGTMGDTRDPHGDVVFIPLRTARGYITARNRLLANQLPILDGTLAFELADPDFLPEALAYDSTRRRFLVGSLHRRVVAAITPNGVATPFINGAPGMLRVVGVHIDAKRERLWFATWAPDSSRLSDSSEAPSVTRLFLADLATGRIQRSWVPDGERPGHLLNDFMERGLTVVNQPTTGTIVGTRFYYIANSQYGRLGESGALEPPTGGPARTAIRVIDLRW